MTTPVIKNIKTGLRVIPLTRPWGPNVTSISVVTVDVSDSDSNVGHGFSWTPSIGGTAVRALLDGDIAPWAIGKEAAPAIWQSAWEHIHEAGGSGITTIALAGLDLALWDLVSRRDNGGVDDLLGRHHDSQPAYGSGVNLHYDIDDLVAQATRWATAGFGAIKVKVGRPHLADDVDRIAAVREAIGPDIGIMIDANQRWDLDTTTRSVERLSEFDLTWLEEPIRADDLASYIELRKRTDVPIALGENVHNWYRFRDFIEMGACDIVQPNIVRVGGITPFLTIADLARANGVETAPHLLADLSARLAVTLPEKTWVEDVEDASFGPLGALEHPSGVEVRDGRAFVSPALGIGVEFSAS